jgi:hypothetical protein
MPLFVLTTIAITHFLRPNSQQKQLPKLSAIHGIPILAVYSKARNFTLPRHFMTVYKFSELSSH